MCLSSTTYTQAFDREQARDPDQAVDELLGRTLAEVGPSITAAAFGEFLAFAVGATTKIPALEQFCLVAAVAVLLDYFLQITWFVAGVSMDARRMKVRGQCNMWGAVPQLVGARF